MFHRLAHCTHNCRNCREKLSWDPNSRLLRCEVALASHQASLKTKASSDRVPYSLSTGSGCRYSQTSLDMHRSLCVALRCSALPCVAPPVFLSERYFEHNGCPGSFSYLHNHTPFLTVVYFYHSHRYSSLRCTPIRADVR